MRHTTGKALAGLFGALSLAAAGTAQAGSAQWDFSTDPTGGQFPLTIGGNGINPGEWQTSGGNPGGFLAVTWPVGGQVSIIAFPNIDPGKVVTAFDFSCDLRVGNSSTDRAADGFSLSFARDGDPVLDENNILSGNQGVFAGGIAEGGATSGIAVSFDTWSGNTLPDGGDIEGIIVRVDNKTVNRTALPTRHGACEDATSLQTGPRDAAYWSNGGDFSAPESWATLCWQPFGITLTEDAKLTVSWKGNKILDGFQTSYFPTAGQLVFAGRTGGANEHTHVDNLKLTTTAASCAAPPSVPANLKVAEAGTRRALISWDPSSVNGDTTALVGYEIERDGTILVSAYSGTQYEATGLDPSKTYTFRVRGKNVCGDPSDWATLSVTTVAEVDSPGILTARQYRFDQDGNVFGGAGLGDMDTVLSNPKWPNQPDVTRYVNGLQFGEPAFGDTWGENHMVAISGILTAPETGSFRFAVRSDDASRFFIKQGTGTIDPLVEIPIAVEEGCCGPFEEPGAGQNSDGSFPTSEPFSLTAGQQYSVLFLVKEGGGGDWGQVGIRKDGASGPFTVVNGPMLTGKGDAVGAVVDITTPPANATAQAYQSATFTVAADASTPYGTAPFYQWYKNGALILGANSATYTIPVVQPGDNGAKIKVAVGVVGKTVESAEATLTVAPQVAAKITQVSGSDSFTEATLTFDQPVVAPSATTAANYTVQGLTVSAAALVDQYTVRLTTSRQTEGATYAVTAKNVANLGGISADTTGSLVAWSLVSGRGRADQYRFNSIDGGVFGGAGLVDMDTVLADPKWPNSPDVVRYVNGLQFGEPAFGDTWGENHMVAIRSVLKPTEGGAYTFHVRSDDASRLFINTSGAAIPDPLVAVPIAVEEGCCGPYEEPGAGQNSDGTFPTSDPVTLTAGQSYGVLFLVKEGGGGDWGQVGWRKAGTTGAVSTIVDNAYWYGPPAPTNDELAISVSGGNVQITFAPGSTLQSADAVTGPYADVAGATSPYSVAPTGASKYYRSRR